MGIRTISIASRQQEFVASSPEEEEDLENLGPNAATTAKVSPIAAKSLYSSLPAAEGMATSKRELDSLATKFKDPKLLARAYFDSGKTILDKTTPPGSVKKAETLKKDILNELKSSELKHDEFYCELGSICEKEAPCLAKKYFSKSKNPSNNSKLKIVKFYVRQNDINAAEKMASKMSSGDARDEALKLILSKSTTRDEEGYFVYDSDSELETIYKSVELIDNVKEKNKLLKLMRYSSLKHRNIKAAESQAWAGEGEDERFKAYYASTNSSLAEQRNQDLWAAPRNEESPAVAPGNARDWTPAEKVSWIENAFTDHNKHRFIAKIGK